MASPTAGQLRYLERVRAARGNAIRNKPKNSSETAEQYQIRTRQEAIERANNQNTSQPVPQEQSKPQTTEQIAAQNPNIVASSRNPNQFISRTGGVVTPVASYQTPATLAPGYSESPGIIFSERNAPTSKAVPVKRTIRSGYEETAGKASKFLRTASEEGYALSEVQRSKSQDREQTGYFGRLLSGTAYYPTRALSYGAGAVADPLERYSQSDKTLGRDIFIGYVVGRGLGLASGALINVAGKTTATRFGSAAGAKAASATQKAIAGVGLGSTALLSYGQTPKEFGRQLPILISGGIGGAKGFRESRPGIIVNEISPVSATKGGTYFDDTTIGGVFTQRRAASLSVYGEPKIVNFETKALLSGSKRTSSTFYDVGLDVYGNIPVGKGISVSESFRGVVTPKSTGLVSQRTGNLFLSKTSTPKSFYSQDGVIDVFSARSRGTTFSLDKGGVNVLSSSRSNILFEQTKYNQNIAGLIKTPRGDTLGFASLGSRPRTFVESSAGSVDVSGRAFSRSSFRNDVFELLAQRDIIRKGTRVSFQKVPRGFNKRGELAVSLSRTRNINTKPNFKGSLSGIDVGVSLGSPKGFTTPFFGVPVSRFKSSVASRSLLSPSTRSRGNIISLPRNDSFQRNAITPVSIITPIQRGRQQQFLSPVSSFSPTSETKNPFPTNFDSPTSRPNNNFPLIRPPVLPGGGGGVFGFSGGRRARERNRYINSFYAGALNIRSKSLNPKSSGFTGLEVRGVIGNRTKRRRL